MAIEVVKAPENGTRPQRRLTAEIGTTGLKHHKGQLYEEFLDAWKSSKKERTIREMMTDAVNWSALLVYELLIRQVKWEFEPADDTDQAAIDVAEFCTQVYFEDMSRTWSETLAEHLTMLQWGWSYSEIVYKRRRGFSRNPALSSRFNDGKIGVRKIAPRAQSTLDGWMLSPSGDVLGMEQSDPFNGLSSVEIPIDRSLHFRTSSENDNPEGRSLLRSAFISWYQKKNIAELQAIRIERDTTGVPVLYVPAKIAKAQPGEPEYPLLEMYKRIATNMRLDNQAGLVLPSDMDEHGNAHYRIELLGSAGDVQMDVLPVIQQLNREIMMATMTDIMLLGHEKVGSLALADNKTSLLSYGLGAMMDSICEVYERHALPRLLRLNGIDQDLQPSLIHGDIESVDPKELAEAILTLANAGYLVDDLEPEVRRQLSLPQREGDEGDDEDPAPQPRRTQADPESEVVE